MENQYYMFHSWICWLMVTSQISKFFFSYFDDIGSSEFSLARLEDILLNFYQLAAR